MTSVKDDAFSLFGHDLFGGKVLQDKSGPLAQRFVFPPFSVLDAKTGDWQERKRAWIALGIQSEIGRGGNTGDECHPGNVLLPACNYGTSKERGDSSGKPVGTYKDRKEMPVFQKGLTYNGPEVQTPGLNYYRDKEKGVDPYGGARKDISGGTGYVKGSDNISVCVGTMGHISAGTSPDIAKRFAESGTGTSIFDPTLCEIIYRWFCPPGGVIVDPFAGGSVRGLVAALSGFRYWGCDLSAAQVAANELQRDTIMGPPLPLPDFVPECVWVVDDAMNIGTAAPPADFIFTCPPYGDLERYSDDPKDLSTMDYRTFMAALRKVAVECAGKLKQNRFAGIVVSDFRDRKTGHYRGFVADTIRAFQDAGLPLYNDAVLLNMIGSLPIRAGKQFAATRKLGKTHQNVLIFIKGDPREATGAICAEGGDA